MTERSKKRIPVLFVLPDLDAGGSERVVLNLCKQLQTGFLPVVAAFSGGELAEEFKKAGAEVQVLKRCGGVDLRLTFRLLKIIKRHRIQVVNSHHFVCLFYTFWASRLSGTPLIHTEHSRWEMEKLPKFWKFCFHYILKHLEMVTTVSRGAYDYLTGCCCIAPSRVRLIQNGIETDLFRREASSGLSRQDLGLAADDLIVGTVGNLRTEKNQELLVRTAALLAGQGKATKFLVVGDGPCRSQLELLAAQLGVSDRIVFLGVRHDVPKIYPLMDIYCLPSRYEGLPLTLLEAMAATVPIVATDVLGIREMIEHRKTGLLIPDNDPQQLKEALLTLDQQPALRSSLAKRGLVKVTAEYGFTTFVNGYKTLFSQFGT